MPEKSAGSSKISQTGKSLNLFKFVIEIISGGSFWDEGGQGYVSYVVIRWPSSSNEDCMGKQ